MQANLRRAGWRCVSALVTVLGSQTWALAQFSTALPPGMPPGAPAAQERQLPPPPVFAGSTPAQSKARNSPPRSRTLVEALRSWLVNDPPPATKKATPHAAQPTTRKLQLTASTDAPRPLPAAGAKNKIATADLRFPEGAGAAGRSVSTPRTSATSRLPEIRLRPIGVIPPENGP